MRSHVLPLMLLVTVLLLTCFVLNLLLGSVQIPLHSVWGILTGSADENIIWHNIIWKSRMPQALTATVAGAALSVSGLQMQTVFRNPLADPSVLGVSAGASLGVAFVVLLSGTLGHVALSSLGYLGELTMSVAAIIGAHYRRAEILQRGRGHPRLRHLGIGQLCPRVWRPSGIVRLHYGGAAPTFLPAGQADEPLAAGQCLCP